MPKLPAVNLTKGKAVMGTIVALLGQQAVEALKDPERAEQIKSFVTSLGPTFESRSPERKLEAKIQALRTTVTDAPAVQLAEADRQNWLDRLDALDAKRTLVTAGFTGRQRAKQVKALSKQVDELLMKYLALSDERINSDDENSEADEGSATP
ncbi:MAG: hypothetical protein Q4F65_08450 [Propionibacteriaceae bacterium]|nr:hypothetical protein [Propionibacteriaceae bacterium]